MAGTGTKTKSGISTATTEYGWDPLYSSTNYVVSASNGQTALYGSPYWFEKLLGSGNQTIYPGGFFSTTGYDIGTGASKVAIAAYQADYVNGGTGSNWISMRAFDATASGLLAGVSDTLKKASPATAGNNYSDYGAVPTSLISGSGARQDITGTPGVVVNLGSQPLGALLAPLIRSNNGSGAIANYGLQGGLSDFLTARLINSGAMDGKDNAGLFSANGVGANEYAFAANGEKYATGTVLNIQNVQGSNSAANLIVAGAASGILQGGVKDDILIGGSGNNQLYGMGGADLLVATSGNTTMYAGQYGLLGKTTPKAAIAADGTPVKGATMVAGTGVVTMVGSDLGNDLFLAGQANGTVYGSGLGGTGAGRTNGLDQDTLSFVQIGTTYFKDYKNLTVTINYSDAAKENGTAVGTFTTSGGSIATLFNLKFFDIENIFSGSVKMVFKDMNGQVFYPETLNAGYTGGDPAVLNNTTGLLDPGPATSTLTGNKPNGNNVLLAGAGGNTNFDGGSGTNNTLDFSSAGSTTFYDCEDNDGSNGTVRNFSLVLNLSANQDGTGNYTYQQNINGTPTVYGGSVKNIQNVTGTYDCSDIMIGKADTMSLTGGGGDFNIIYAGGGIFQDANGNWKATTLTGSRALDNSSNGGAEHNWVVFQNPTELIRGLSGSGAGASSPYSAGVNANLDPEYSFTSTQGLVTGSMVGFANILGTSGNDTITGDKNDNILVGADGNDTISGGGEHDTTVEWGGANVIYGGKGTNVVTGGSLNDGKSDVFVVGYNYNPVAASVDATTREAVKLLPEAWSSTNRNGEVFASTAINGGNQGIVTVAGSTLGDAVDYIQDWKNSDGLYVSQTGKAIIERMNYSSASSHITEAITSSTNHTINVSAAKNLGEIYITAGDGNNVITGSDIVTGSTDANSGRDIIVSGNGANWIDAKGGNNEVTTGSGNDTINANGGNDRILAGSGHNLVTAGDGDNYVKTLEGNDTITSGSGNDRIIAGAGNNTVTAGGGDDIITTLGGDDVINLGEGADKVFSGAGYNVINVGKADGTADSSADAIYIDSFQARYQITGFGAGDKIYLDSRILTSFSSALSITTPGGYNVDQTAVKSGSLGVGQNYDNGWYPVSELLYDVTYNGILSAYNATPRDPDYIGPLQFGWASNGAWSNSAHLSAGEVSKIAVIAAGAVSLYIGNGLAAIPFVGPFLAIPFWVNGALMIYNGVEVVAPHLNATYGGVTLDAGVDLLDNNAYPSSTLSGWDAPSFLDFYQKPSDQFTPSLEFSNHPAGTGICSFVTVYNGTETFIYAVFSKDGIVQNNETRLVAQVNGRVTADQLVIKDLSTDSDYSTYSNSTGTVTPRFPSAVDKFELSVTGGAHLANNGTLTDSAAPTVVITFDKPLTAADTVVVTIDGVQQTLPVQTGTTVELALTGLSEGNHAVSISVKNDQDFTSNASWGFSVDTTPPDAAKATVGSFDGGIVVSTSEIGDYTYAIVAGGNVIGEWKTSGEPLILTAPGTVTEASIQIKDAFGRTTTLGETVFLGTTGNDTINASGASGKAIVFGFDGNDTITGSNKGDDIYGGAGNDSIVAGSGNNFIAGGAGVDSIALSSGAGKASTLQFSTSATASDSSTATPDSVTGFQWGQDHLLISATGVTSFDGSTDASKSGSDLTFDFQGAQDVEIHFGSTVPVSFAASISYDLTGTSGNDTLAGGAGADTLTGGEGVDTFGILAGSSAPVFGGTGQDGTVAGNDVITDFSLAGGDKLDMPGTASVAGDGSLAVGAGAALTVGTAAIDHITISNGAVSFVSASSTLNIADSHALAAAIEALTKTDIGDAGSTVFFASDVNGAHHTYVYTQAGSGAGGDFVDLSGITASSIATSSPAAGGIWIG